MATNLNRFSGVFCLGFVFSCVLENTWANSAVSVEIPKRAPAVHAEGYLVQDEPTYCSDLARKFCDQIPGVKEADDRLKRFSESFQSVIKSSEEVSAFQKIFELLSTSIKAKGFPVRKDLKPEHLEEYFSPSKGYGAGSASLRDIFSFDDQVCSGNKVFDQVANRTLANDLRIISATVIPSDESFEILSSGSDLDPEPIRNFRDSLRGSLVAKNVVDALGDFEIDNQESRTKFSENFVNYISEYSNGISKIITEAQSDLISKKSLFAQYALMCQMLKNAESQKLDIESDECDISLQLDVVHRDGFDFALVKKDFERLVIDYKRKIWSRYQEYLSGRSGEMTLVMSRAFKSLSAKGISDQSDFNKAIVKLSEQSQVVRDVSDQIGPYVNVRLDTKKVQQSVICAKRDELLDQAITQEYERVQRLVRRSYDSVSFVQDKLFPIESMEHLSKTFENVSLQSQFQFEKISYGVENENLRKRLVSAFKNIKLYDPTKVEDVYTVDSWTGLKVLDYNKIPSHDPFYALFSDRKLEDLGVINAFLTSGHLAQLGSHPGIFMTPAKVEAYRNHPGSVFFLLTHEMAHLLDPRVFTELGEKFPAQYRQLLECFARKESVGAKEHQHGECFSDWFATEVLANMVGQLKKEQRFAYVQDSFLGLCELSRQSAMASARKGGVRFDSDEHPPARKRINAILGAHPVIREALGCRLPSEAPYCALSDSPRSGGM